MKTLYFKSIIHFFAISFFLAMIAQLSAQQNHFEKTSYGNGFNLFYQFTDSNKEQHELSIELSELRINEANLLIPKLNILRKKFQQELPSLANDLAKESLYQINENYREHVAKLHQFLEKQQLPEGRSITIDCPQEVVQFNLRAPSNSNIVFNQNVSTEICGFKSNSKNLFQELIQNIKKNVQTVNQQLPSSTIYKVITSNRSYRFRIQLREKDKAKQDRAERLIKKSQTEIKQLQKNYEFKTQQLKQIFQTLTQNHYSYIEQIKPLINQSFQSIFKNISEKNKAFYEHHYLTAEKKGNHFLIYPDYQRLAEHFLYDLQPIASYLGRQSTERRTIEVALNFLQSIPYNRLEGRDIEGLSGFLTPVSLLYQNQGDCDSKSVALISILNNLLPNTKKLIVLIHQHAFVAIQIAAKKHDITLPYQGENYVIAEVAGPAIFPLGKASRMTQRAIQSNQIQKIISF